MSLFACGCRIDLVVCEQISSSYFRLMFEVRNCVWQCDIFVRLGYARIYLYFLCCLVKLTKFGPLLQPITVLIVRPKLCMKALCLWRHHHRVFKCYAYSRSFFTSLDRAILLVASLASRSFFPCLWGAILPGINIYIYIFRIVYTERQFDAFCTIYLLISFVIVYGYVVVVFMYFIYFISRLQQSNTPGYLCAILNRDFRFNLVLFLHLTTYGC